MTDVKHLLKQAQCGEFSPLDSIARSTDAEHFAAMYGDPFGCVQDWGKKNDKGESFYKGVEVNGTWYLWRRDTGKYDGWDRPLIKFHDVDESGGGVE